MDRRVARRVLNTPARGDHLAESWRSQADFAALKDNTEARPHMQAAAKLASFEPILCEVVDAVATD